MQTGVTWARSRQETRVRRVSARGDDMDEIRRKLPALTMLEGSTGRIEVYGQRGFFNICLTPLGPLMGLPVVGQKWAEYLSPAGVDITDRGGLGGFGPDCDAYIDWVVPSGFQGIGARADMGQARMAIGPVALVAVLLAGAGALAALAWAIKQIYVAVRAIVEDIGEVFDPTKPLGKVLWAALGIGLVIWGSGKLRKRGAT